MNTLLVLPLLIPLAGAAASLLVWRSRVLQRAIVTAAAAALLVAAVALLVTVRRDGIAVTEVGDWPAPFGIVLVADLLSALLVTVAAVVWLAVVVFSHIGIDRRRESFGYYPLTAFLMMGVCGAFITGDLFNLYVWFEVMLIASFVLIAFGGDRKQFQSGIKYVTLNLMASALFLAGVGIIYGVTGVLNMAELSGRLNDVQQPGLVAAIAVLFFVSFGIKAAVFPLFFWLPASYHTPPAAATALFAGLLTKVGVYALFRVFTLLFVQHVDLTHTIILVTAGLTMVTGVFGAVSQNDFRRILSFHIVSQIGYMIMGLGLFTRFAMAASIFYIIHHIIVKTNLFLISGVVERMRRTADLKLLGGVWKTTPVLGVLFLVPALSLAGIPPLSGFFAKLTLVRAGLEAEQYIVTAAAVATGFVTLFSMMKIWNEAFWKPAPNDDVRPPERQMLIPIAALAALTLAIGLTAGWLFDVSLDASDQILDRSHYIRAVLR